VGARAFDAAKNNSDPRERKETTGNVGIDMTASDTVVRSTRSLQVKGINPFNEAVHWKPGVYYGQVDANGKPHGRGVTLEVIKWKKTTEKSGSTGKKKKIAAAVPNKIGKQFDGTYIHGQRSGGTIVFPDGKIYQGSVTGKSGKPHGFGCETRVDGDRYMGYWRNGKRNGLGVRMWPEGQTYAGEWASGKMNGVGMFTWPSGLRYLGEWQEHKRHGLGVEIHRDTTTSHYYCGQWSNGKRNGYGERCKREAGQTWSGAFVDGNRDKKGDVAATATRTDERTAQRLGWEAARTALPVARKAVVLARESMEAVGRNYIHQIRTSTTVKEVTVAMRALHAATSNPMCRVQVRDILECVTEWKRRLEETNRKQERTKVAHAEKMSWNQNTAQTFGQLLHQCRTAARERKQEEAKTSKMLNSFRDLSWNDWL